MTTQQVLTTELLSVSEVAQQIGCLPREISDAIYRRFVPADACPLIAGRRLIPVEMVSVIKNELAERRARRKVKTDAVMAG